MDVYIYLPTLSSCVCKPTFTPAYMLIMYSFCMPIIIILKSEIKNTETLCLCGLLSAQLHTCLYIHMYMLTWARSRENHWWWLREPVSRPKDIRPWPCHLLVVRSKLLRLVFQAHHSLAYIQILNMCPLLQPEQALKAPGMSLVHPLFYTRCENLPPSQTQTSVSTLHHAHTSQLRLSLHRDLRFFH